MGGGVRLTSVLSLTVMIGAVAVTATAGGSLGPFPPPRPAVTGPRTSAENEATAQSEAALLLTQLSLPAGATPSSSEPAGDGGLLAQPGIGPPATPNAVDDHAWWIVPGPARAVLDYAMGHHPPGVAETMSSSLLSYGALEDEDGRLSWPSIPGVLTERGLLVTVAQLPDGSTALRADSQVVWLTPRTAPPIPPGTHLLWVSVASSIKGNQPKQRPLRVTSPRKLDEIVALVNALPASQPGLRNCPVDFGVTVQLAFFPRRGPGPPAGVAPLAIVHAAPGGCGRVQLKLDGSPQPGLEGARSLIEGVDRVLGVELNVLPPRPSRRAPVSERDTVTT